jgi:Ca-activated chloride channel family protein
MTSQLSVIATPRRPALLAGFDNQVEVLVRIQAPAAPPDTAAPRPPYAIALVLDRSGSMGGAPMLEARRCAAYVAGHLRGDDRVALVSFNHHVRVLHPLQARGDGRALQAAIEGIRSGGNTDLHGGWRAGADALSSLPESAVALKRVILLSDGQANHGLTSTSDITLQCAAAAAQGISTSTYGLGNNFNEDLMVAMGQTGRGNHYYGDTAADLMEPFEQELSLLQNLCACDITLRAKVPAGVGVEALNPYPGNAEEGWRLPDLPYGAEAWMVLRLTVPKALLPEDGKPLHLLEVTATGSSLAGLPVPLPPAWLKLPALPQAAFGALGEDALVMRRLDELEAGQLLVAARAVAATGNWDAVDGMLAQARSRFAGNPWVAGVIESIEKLARRRDLETFTKEAVYTSTHMFNRITETLEAADMGDEAAKLAYLRRRLLQGKSGYPRQE